MQTHETVKSFVKHITDISGQYSPATIFNDFCTIAMASLHNGIHTTMHMPVPDKYKATVDKLENEYTKTIKKYDALAFDKFANALALLAQAMQAAPNDYLGEAYMSMGIGNANAGQFFTPGHICELMAIISTDKANIYKQAQAGEPITVYDPACGSGAMAIGFVNALEKHYKVCGYRNNLHISLIDIDLLCIKMAYIQMALLGVPAILKCGNTLTGEIYDMFYTPDMQIKLLSSATRAAISTPSAAKPKGGQLSLF